MELYSIFYFSSFFVLKDLDQSKMTQFLRQQQLKLRTKTMERQRKQKTTLIYKEVEK